MSPVLEMRPATSDERHVERNVSAIYNRAIVMGGSMAGLAAARVLSDHYREVVLVERDELEKVPGHPQGDPHGRPAGGPSGRASSRDCLRMYSALAL